MLTDFGLSKPDCTITSTFLVGAGSLRWTAPELLYEKSKGKASDVYAFAITIYEVRGSEEQIGGYSTWTCGRFSLGDCPTLMKNWIRRSCVLYWMASAPQLSLQIPQMDIPMKDYGRSRLQDGLRILTRVPRCRKFSAGYTLHL